MNIDIHDPIWTPTTTTATRMTNHRNSTSDTCLARGNILSLVGLSSRLLDSGVLMTGLLNSLWDVFSRGFQFNVSFDVIFDARKSLKFVGMFFFGWNLQWILSLVAWSGWFLHGWDWNKTQFTRVYSTTHVYDYYVLEYEIIISLYHKFFV